MKLAYIFMNYLAPSEVFGKIEVEALIRNGIEVDKYSLFSKYISGNNECFGIDKIRFIQYLSLLLKFKYLYRYILFCKKISKTLVEFIKLIYLFPRAEYLVNEIIKKEYDIVHLFWGHYPSICIFLLKNKKFTGKISIFTGAYDLESKTGIMEYGVKTADTVWTHANYNKNIIKEFFSGKVNVIYRGINCNNTNIINKTHNEKLSLIFTGRLTEVKKPDVVIELVYKLIIYYKSNVTLDIFGDGNMKIELLNLVNKLSLQENITFHGHTSQDEMFKYFKKAHFFIFPSIQESERLPNSVKESMNQGCIPIVSNTKGIDELVHNNVSGFIVDFNNLNKICEKIIFLSSNIEEYQKVSENAQLTVRNKFCIDILTQQRIKLLQGVL